jgi:hypothetical protein
MMRSVTPGIRAAAGLGVVAVTVALVDLRSSSLEASSAERLPA